MQNERYHAQKPYIFHRFLKANGCAVMYSYVDISTQTSTQSVRNYGHTNWQINCLQSIGYSDETHKPNNMRNFENDNVTGVNDSGLKANTPVKYLTASSIVGDKIYNNTEEKLGDIKDLMINIIDGKIEYVIIEFGGFLGIGEKYFAVPYQALRLDIDRHAYVLNQGREVLENAPGFDKDHWPETNSHEFDKVVNYWGSFMGPNTGTEY